MGCSIIVILVLMKMYKWFSPVDKLTVMEPDYNNDIWDEVLEQGIATHILS